MAFVSLVTLVLCHAALVLANTFALGFALRRSTLAHAFAVARMIMDDDDILGRGIHDGIQKGSGQTE